MRRSSVLSLSRWSIAALPWAALACSFEGPGGGGGDIDAGTDACADWTPANFELCALPEPSAPLELSGGAFVYNTSTGMLMTPSGPLEPATAVVDLSPPVRIIHVESFVLGSGAELEVRGDHPLIIASASTIDVAGFIDVASIEDRIAGAGADPAICTQEAAGNGIDNMGGGGGGGGGGHAASGGAGGEGDNNDDPAAGGSGGQVLPEPQTPRGGCRGGKGGLGGAGAGGAGGSGGGAVQLSAASSIAIRTSALIAASGGGGLGGTEDDGGGGGGGSGGFIGLDAPSVTIADGARLVANGGGGGGGADDEPGTGGGSAADDADPALGGSSGGNGSSDGGPGGSLESPNAPDVTETSNRGAGGGGGSVGYILIWVDDLDDSSSAVISPAATTLPRR